MTEYQIGNAIVRIHGVCDQDSLHKATARFLKRARQQRKKVRNEAREKANERTAQVDGKVEA